MTTLEAMENTMHHKSRVWYVLGGFLSILVGFYAMGRPGLATFAVTQVVGIIALASGIVLLFAALFSQARQHRLYDFFSAALRIAVGLLLLANVLKGVLLLTLVLGSVFVIEGIYSLLLGVKLRARIRHGAGWSSTAWQRSCSASCSSRNFPAARSGRSVCFSGSTAF